MSLFENHLKEEIIKHNGTEKKALAIWTFKQASVQT